MDFFKTRIHVYHPGLAFFSLLLSWVLLCEIPCVCPPKGLFRILVIPFFHIIQIFLLYSFCFDILLQNSFASFLFGCWFIFVDKTRLCRNFFRYFKMSYFVFIAWTCFGIFQVSLLPLGSFDLSFQVVLLDSSAVFFVFSFKQISACFSFLITFDRCRSFFTCSSNRTWHPGLYFSSGYFGEHRFYHRLISLLHKLTCLIQWWCPLGYLVIICLFFFYFHLNFFFRAFTNYLSSYF